MNEDRVPIVLDKIGALGFRVTALVNEQGIEIVAIDQVGETYRVKAGPEQRYEACCELAKQLGVNLTIEPEE